MFGPGLAGLHDGARFPLPAALRAELAGARAAALLPAYADERRALLAAVVPG